MCIIPHLFLFIVLCNLVLDKKKSWTLKKIKYAQTPAQQSTLPGYHPIILEPLYLNDATFI